jgi:signal transduction histidine kinase
MSLRVRLVLLVLTLTTLLLGGLGLYVGGSLRTWTVESVDAELTRRAEVLVHEVHFEDGQLEVDEDDDLGERSWPFRLETATGEVLRSDGAEWATRGLPAQGFATISGRAGKPLRVLSVSFQPDRGESEARLVLRVAAPLSAFSGLAERFRTGLAVALALAALLGGAGAALLAGIFLAPLRRLSKAADGIEATSLETRLDTRGLDPELSRLAAAFNGVLGRLADAFATQRAFVGRASHALRTPLATILSQAEVALLRERTPQAYREALGLIAESARDSARLADGLLALTRADAAQGAEAPVEVRLDELAQELTRLLSPRAEAAGLAFSAHAPPGLALKTSRSRLREMLDALLDNAVRYTPAGGRVGFEARQEGAAVVLEVVDSGPGIKAEERTQVFERFYRGSAASQSGQRGSGLGLSVVQALAASEGARVELDEAPGGGARVRLRYPARG